MKSPRAAALLAAAAVSIASASDFTWTGTLDPRDDEWSVPAHWDGLFGFYPSTRSDSALIDGPGIFDPVLDIDVAIGSVTIRDGRTLDTNGFEYSVFTSGGLSGDTIIEGAGSMLRIFNDPSNPNNAGSGIIVNDGGTLLLDTTGLPVNLAARKLDINTGGLVEGAGTLTQLGRTGVVSNDGTLRAARITSFTGGTLVLQPWDAGDVFDWDGPSENGRIEVDQFSELRIEMEVEPSFNGWIELYAGAVLDVEESWTLSDGGILDTTSSVFADAARIRGGPMGVRGQIQVDAGDLVLEAETYVLPTGRVIVTLGNTIQFDAPASFIRADGLEYLSGGTGLIVNSTLMIGSGLGSGRFDMDGPTGNHQTKIGSGGELTIDADGIDETNDKFDGDLELRGVLDLTVADGEWEMAGELVSITGDSSTTVIDGSAVRVTGTVDVQSGDLEFRSNTIFDTGSAVAMDRNDEIRAAGPVTTLNGTTFIGGNRPALLSPLVRVTGDTSITSDINLVLGDDTTLEIDAPLRVSTLLIRSETPGPEIRGTTTITAPGFLEFTSTDTSGNDRTQIFDGTVTLFGAAGVPLLRGNEAFRLQGSTTVTGDTEIQAAVEFAGPVSLGLDSELRLLGGTPDQPNIVEPTARFTSASLSSPGRIEVAGETRVLSGASLDDGETRIETEIGPGGVLTLEPGSDASRQVRNFGTIKLGDPGEPIGSTNCERFEQSGTGRLIIRVGPTGADSIVEVPSPFPFSPFVSLSGELVVVLEDGFTPGDGEIHTILSYGTRFGLFNTVTGPENMDVLYFSDGVRIRFNDPACSAADIAEPFGELNIDDVLSFLNAFAAGSTQADLAAPIGTLNIDDVLFFLNAFAGGCP